MAAERLVLWLRFGQSVDSEAALVLIRQRVKAHRGQLLVQLGSLLVCTLDPVDAAGAVEIFLDVSEGLRETAMLRAGLSIGPVRSTGQQHVGDALPRAEMLGQFADIGQLLVEQAAHERLRANYLFSAPKQVGQVTVLGLDPRQPSRADCARNRRLLRHSSLARIRRGEFERIRAELAQGARDWLAVRTVHAYDALDLVTELADTLQPAFLMHLRRHGDRLQPLGSLVCGLASLDLDGRPELTAHLNVHDRDILQRLQAGRAVPRADVRDAVRGLLSPPYGRAWVVCDQVADLDGATLALLAKELVEPSGPLLIVSLRPDDPLPSRVTPPSRLLEVSLAPATREELVELASETLGRPHDPALAQHVVYLAGTTALGTLEACRTLVTTGDLVPTDGTLSWRTGPRAAHGAASVQDLLAEQLSSLSATAHRLLEAVCVSPPFSTRDFVEAVGRGDGLSEADAALAFPELQEAGWLTAAGHLGHRHREVREAILVGMPPARSAELHRFAGSVWQDWNEVATPGFSRALLGYYWWQGGRLELASACLMDAAEQAVACDFPRAGVRLAANAVHLAPDDRIRDRARDLVRGVEGDRTTQFTRATRNTPSTPPKQQAGVDAPQNAVRAACAAIARSEPETAERLLDAAVAAGWRRPAAQRLRAVSQLCRGDLVAARQALEGASPADADTGRETHEPTNPRDTVAWALVHLESGDPLAAIRNALAALATCRMHPPDQAGQAAALATLAASYRCLGEASKADALAELAAMRVHRP